MFHFLQSMRNTFLTCPAMFGEIPRPAVIMAQVGSMLLYNLQFTNITELYLAEIAILQK